jgi:hypothetical protein
MRCSSALAAIAKMPLRMSAFRGRADMAARGWILALEYQEKAAKLDDGKRPDLGDPPITLLTRK